MNFFEDTLIVPVGNISNSNFQAVLIPKRSAKSTWTAFSALDAWLISSPRCWQFYLKYDISFALILHNILKNLQYLLRIMNYI